MLVPGYRDCPVEPWDQGAPVDPGEAESFLRRCYTENPRLGPVEPRLAIVRAQIAATGTYVHTTDELGHGARMAWRNASRCIGRLYWRSLMVLDRRRARTADEIYSLLVQHLRRRVPAGATGVRPVRSALTSREWEVLDLLCERKTTDLIAEELFLSPETVRSHIKAIFRKLGVNSRQEAVARADGLRAEFS